MAIPLLFQTQTVFIVCCALGPGLSRLPKSLPLEEGEDEKFEKPLTSLGYGRVGSLLMAGIHH